jgi:hypothetical protein
MIEVRSLRDWTESASHNRLLGRAVPLINPYALEPTLSKANRIAPPNLSVDYLSVETTVVTAQAIDADRILPH